MTARHHYPVPAPRLATGLALGLIAFTVAAVLLRRPTAPRPRFDAPPLARARASGGWRHSFVGRTVTVSRPRKDVYDAWRDFMTFPAFMENVESVHVLDETRSRWTINAPGGAAVTLDVRMTEDRPSELIAWETVPDAPVQSSGEVRFADAPGGRGTTISLRLEYDPPLGAIGKAAAKLFQREPAIQARRELKRFKQWMETGEVAISSATTTAASLAN